MHERFYCEEMRNLPEHKDLFFLYLPLACYVVGWSDFLPLRSSKYTKEQFSRFVDDERYITFKVQL